MMLMRVAAANARHAMPLLMSCQMLPDVAAYASLFSLMPPLMLYLIFSMLITLSADAAMPLITDAFADFRATFRYDRFSPPMISRCLRYAFSLRCHVSIGATDD